MQASNDSDGPGDTFIARLSEAERRRLADDLFSGDPDGVPEDFHEGQTEPTMLESAFGTINSAVTAVNAVNADIARGVTETPRAMISGAIDAGNAVFGLAGDTMEGIAGLVGVENPQFDVTIPNLDKPESVTGNVVKGVSQFLLPFGALGKASKGLGILQGGGFGTQVARASAQGAIADFAAFKGSEASLGEMLNEIPALKGPVTEFMASGPEDSEVEARLKNALEGVGLGLAFEGVLKGLRATRELIKSRRKVVEPGAEPEVPEQNFEMLGDINDDALVKIQRAGDPETTFADDLADIDDLRRSKIDRAQADQAGARADRARTTGKIADAIEETDTGVPDDVAARAIAKPPGTAGDDAAEVTVGDLKQLNDSKPVRTKPAAANEGAAPAGAAGSQVSVPDSRFIDDIADGKIEVPDASNVRDVVKNIKKAEDAQLTAEGFTVKEIATLRSLNRQIDAGGPHADQAIREKEALLAKHPAGPEADILDEDTIKQLSVEFENLERVSGETVSEFADGIQSVLKRYLVKFTEDDGFARAVFRKAFVEAEKQGIDVKALSQDVIERFVKDLPKHDADFMRQQFADFLVQRKRRVAGAGGEAAGQQGAPAGASGEAAATAGQQGTPIDVANRVLEAAARSAELGKRVRIADLHDVLDLPPAQINKALQDLQQAQKLVLYDDPLTRTARDKAAAVNIAGAARQVLRVGDATPLAAAKAADGAAPKKAKALVYELDGFFDKKRALVAMATDGMNAANAVRHEAIHALRESGVITPQQWATLRATARNLKWKTKFKVEDRYEKMYKERFGNVEGEERMLEEAVADAFAAFRQGETFDEPTNKVLGYMSRLVERTASALRGRGFQNAEDIFKKIEEGELVGQRGRGRAREAFESGDVIVKRPGPLAQDAAQAVADALRILPDGTKLQIEDKIRRRVEQSPVAEKDKVFVNMARIDAEQDVARTVTEMADAFKEGIDEARGGVQTFAETKLSAGQIDAWNALKERRDGQFPDAATQLAVRELWVQSADRLTFTANLAEKTPSPENLFAFRKQFATHAMIQKEVLAIRTETARALSAWRIPVGAGGAMRARQLDDAIYAFGGLDVNQALAARVAALARQPNGAEAVEAAISKGATARTMDAVREFWINGLLSGPKTHLVNMLSNTSVAALRVGERALAAQISKALGTDLGVEVGEAAAMVAGGIGGLQDGMIYAYRTLRTGETGQYNTDLAGRGRGVGLDKQTAKNVAGARQRAARPSVSPQGTSSVAEGNKVESQSGSALQQRAIGATLFGVREDSYMGKAADLIGAALNAPTRALAAEDELFKTLGYRMELHAQAVRMARREVNAGTIPEAEYKSRMADIIQDPPESVQLAAIDSATYQTFTNKTGKVANQIKGLREAIPGAQYILPFVNTPANIMSFAFERTPMAPLVGRFREAFNAGGHQRDLAMAQLGAGIMISGAAFDMAMRGQVTGGGPSKSNTSERQALLRRGWQPYSIRIGDRYYAYNRLDPVGLMMGMSADMFEISTASDFSDGYEMDEVVSMVGASVAGNLINKTYLRTLAEVFNVGSDPQRYASPFLERFAGSFIPAIVNEAKTFDDPVARYSTDVIERMKSRTPILSAELPPRRDLWGREISFSSGLGAPYDMVSPIYSKVRKEEPIDTELASQGFYISMPSRRLGYNGVYFNTRNRADVYSRYIQLQGNDLKHPAFGMGAKDLLNAIVSGKHDLSSAYESLTDGDEGGKERMLRQLVTSYRQLARSQILQEFPDVAAEVQQELEERRRALQGIQQ